MGKYERRDFQIGPWYIGQREGSPAFYRCRYNATTRTTERFSLHHTDYEAAKEALTAWYYENLRLASDYVAPEKMPLADVLLDYWNNHAQQLASAKSRKILVRYWNEFWGEASVADVRSMGRQEDFHRFLFAKGLNVGSVNRVLECGTAAINRAYKRGAISHAPYVAKLPDRREVPKGRPLTVEELQALYRGSEVEHWHDLMTIMLCTACRPGAARELTKAQLDPAMWRVDLNPPGRVQTHKRRPVVRMTDSLWERFKTRPDGVLVRWRGEATEKNERLMRVARVRAGLDEAVNLYSIRHTCARWMRMEGVPSDQLASQLGHQVPDWGNATMRYAPNSPDYLEKAAAALEKLCRAVCEPNTGIRGS